MSALFGWLLFDIEECRVGVDEQGFVGDYDRGLDVVVVFVFYGDLIDDFVIVGIDDCYIIMVVEVLDFVICCGRGGLSVIIV